MVQNQSLFRVAVLPSRKSDQYISKSDFYQTIFLSKIGLKADPNSLFWGKNQNCSQNLILTLGKSTFIWKYSIFKDIFSFFFLKAKTLKIRLFEHFGPNSGLFRQKEDKFRSIISKMSAIRPRSDKADLLSSTGLFDYWPNPIGQEPSFIDQTGCLCKILNPLLLTRSVFSSGARPKYQLLWIWTWTSRDRHKSSEFGFGRTFGHLGSLKVDQKITKKNVASFCCLFFWLRKFPYLAC